MDFWEEIALPIIDGKNTYYICGQPDEKYKGIPLFSSYGIKRYMVDDYIKQRSKDIHRFSLTHKDADIFF